MSLRIGTGAGFSGDRIQPAIDLAMNGELDYLVFECLAERTIAKAQLDKVHGRSPGYDPLLKKRMQAVLGLCAQRKTRIVTNMGAANPAKAAKFVREFADSSGLEHLRIALVEGDDVTAKVIADDTTLDELHCSIGDLGEAFVAANAYLGAQPVVEALRGGADIVITGRIADPAMFLAPMVYEFGWDMDDWAKLGQGTVVGHLLECGAQVTGGYFLDPGKKEVPDIAHLGFPIAEVEASGSAIITKTTTSGGCVTEATCKEQLLYEVHDPSSYFQPDVIADFTEVTVKSVGPDRVRITGGTGRQKNRMLKTSVGYFDSWVGEGEITYAGPNALARARAAADVVRQRTEQDIPEITEIRCDLIGVNSVVDQFSPHTLGETPEVRVRFAARVPCREDAIQIEREFESLYLNGPAGGGGIRTSARQILAVTSVLIPECVAATCVKFV